MTTYKEKQMANHLSLFKNRSLLIVGISESVSNTGNWITGMAVFAMIVFKGDGTILQSSGIYLAGLLPILLFSPAAGWLSDRFDRKKLMIASEILSGLAIIGLIFVTKIEWIYFLLALQAIFISWMTPARQASIPQITNEEDLPKANALLQQLASIVKIIAPLLAGAILMVMSPHQAIILDVISFALSALILTRLPSLPPQKEARTAQGQMQSDEGSVLKVLQKNAGLRLLFLSMFLAIMIIIGFDVLAPIYIRDVLAGNEQLLGIQVSLVGIGMLVSTLLLVLRKKAQNPWRDLLFGLFLLSIIPIGLAFGTVIDGKTARLVTLFACFSGGLGNGLVVVQSATLLQQLSPQSYLGRMGGIFQATAVAGQLCGMLVTPLVVPALLPIGGFFLVSALLIGAVILIIQLMRGRLPAPTSANAFGQD
jgi:MFS family permease